MIDIRIIIYGLSLKNVWYILAISFQLAGALLLICHYMRDTEKQIKGSYFSQDAIVKTENGKVKLRKEKVQDCICLYCNWVFPRNFRRHRR